MGFLGFIRRKGLFGITWGVPGAGTYETSRQFDLGLPLGSQDALDEPYAKHSTVATALSIFVGDAASVGFELYPEGNDDDAIESHPVLTLLDKPAPGMDGFQLRVGTYLSRKLFGEAFWYYPEVELGSRGGLRATSQPMGQILLLDPRAVKLDLTGRMPQWFLQTSGGRIDLDEMRLTQFKRINPYNPNRGLSEIDSVLIEIETDYASAQYNRAFFRDQKGIPTGLLIPSVEAAGSQQERKDFTDKFNSDAASSKRRIATTPPGWKWQDIGVSMKDMEFKGLREYERELILSALGPVPPFMAGVMDKANYANAREQKEMYWLGPQTRFLTEIQSVLNSDFLPKLGVSGVQLYPCWEQVKALVENLSEKVDIATKLFALGFPKRAINERLELGMQVDDLEDADVGYLPFNVTPVSMVLDPPAPAALPAADPNALDAAPPVKTLAFSEGQEKRRALVWRGIVARTRDLEMKFNQVVRRHLREIEEIVLDNVNGIKGWQATQAKGFERKDAVIDLIFDLQAMQLRLQAQASPLQRAAIIRGGESVMSELGTATSFEAANLRVQAKLAELSHKIARIDSTVEAALRDALSDGIAAGESVPQLAERVRQVMDVSKARSMTIARTETGFAFNTGRNEGMKQAGVSRQEWLTARDARVRDSHAAVGVDGQIVGVGEPFTMGSGVTLLYPQDPSGPAEEVINCRCVAIPVVAEA